MYCVNCGVKLADSEKRCPLCGVTAYHPDLPRPEGQRLYPADALPVEEVNRHSLLIVLTTFFLLSTLITLLCDLQISGNVSWSGYVTGALLLAYVIFALPSWFKNPNPVIFVPCDFAAVALYVHYVSYLTDGHWFLSFGLPVIGYVALVVTAVITLLRYVKRGKLYIFGGALIAMGGLMPLMEFLINYTFRNKEFLMWSFYPLIVMALLGGMLIFLAVCRPARETMERKFFI